MLTMRYILGASRVRCAFAVNYSALCEVPAFFEQGDLTKRLLSETSRLLVMQVLPVFLQVFRQVMEECRKIEQRVGPAGVFPINQPEFAVVIFEPVCRQRVEVTQRGLMSG